MPVPVLNEEQRKEALAKAAEARRKRAELKAELKSEKKNLKYIMDTADSDDTVGRMKVTAVLEALPGVGKVKARKVMEQLEIPSERRVRGLGARQRSALLSEFAAT